MTDDEPITDIRVRVVPTPGTEGNLTGRSLTERLEERIDELSDSVASIASRFRASLDRDLAKRSEPSWNLGEVELNFSLDLEAGAGVIVAQAKTTAGFQVTLRWHAPDPR